VKEDETGYTWVYIIYQATQDKIRSDGQALEANPKWEVYSNRHVVESQRIVLLGNSHWWLSLVSIGFV